MATPDLYKTLVQPGVNQPVYCRTHEKADGRLLNLYGYQRHDETPMPEQVETIAKGGHLRWHPLRREWNIYASHRQNRTFKPVAANDPLAPTRKDGPATEIPFSDFELAVFENRFAGLHPEAVAPVNDGVVSDPARGVCEVIVYGPEGAGNMQSIGQEKRRLLLSAWIDRYSALFEKGCVFVLPFENRGDEVGVTLHHPHGQLYGFSHLPPVQKMAAEAYREGYNLAAAIDTFGAQYHVATAGGLVAFCPPYARFPFEVWIAPRERHAGPWEFNAEQFDAYAYLLGDICRRYDSYFECETPYMMSLHAAPLGEERTFHFTTQFYPLLRAKSRVKYLASVEQSTGVFTVDVLPESAANILRTF